MVYICTATCGDLLANKHFKSGAAVELRAAVELQVQFMLADLQLLSELFEVCLFTRYINHVLLATLV